MKPFPVIVAAILMGIAASLILLQRSHSGLKVQDSGTDIPVARKSRVHPHPTFETATIAEKASRPHQAAQQQSQSPDSPAPSASTSDDDKTVNSDEIRVATEFRKALRLESERYDEATGNHVVLHPAAWMDLGEDSLVSQEHQDGIQQIASELREKIAESGLDPETPAYRRLWNDAVRESNWKFRARYGARAWSRHHIQAFHASQAQTNRN